MTLSRSKKRALGIRFSRKVCKPLRGELGKNHDAHTATVRGAVDIFEGEFFFRASESSNGVTRYEESERRADIAKRRFCDREMEDRRGVRVRRSVAAAMMYCAILLSHGNSHEWMMCRMKWMLDIEGVIVDGMPADEYI